MIGFMIGSVFLSGLAAVVIGFVWYSPVLFGPMWMRLTGITPEMAEVGRRKMPLMAFFGLLGAMLVAYVMTYVNAAWGFTTWQGALQLGIWTWIGFVAPTMLGTVLWEGKPFRLYLINALYWLVTFMTMAQIIVFTYSIMALTASTTFDTTAHNDVYDAALYEEGE